MIRLPVLLLLYITFPHCYSIPSSFQKFLPGLHSPEQDHFDLIDLHQDLVTISSISTDERKVSLFLKEYLEDKGVTVELQPIPNETGYNVYAYLGTEKNTKILLTSHIDTVPPYIPYFVEDDKIYGRGASDAKASVAVQVGAFLDLADSGAIKEGDVALLYVVGEEHSGIGMQTASQILNNDWEAVVFSEPTENKLGVGHKGIYVAKLKVHGVAAHSGYPELGRNANSILIDLLYQIQSAQYPTSSLLGKSTVNIGVLKGGVAVNVISDYAEAEVSIRVAAKLQTVKSIVQSIIDSNEYSQYVELEFLASEEQKLDHDVPGFETTVLNYGTDVGNLETAATTKKYLYGPGSILVAHGDDEYVTIASLHQGVTDTKKIVEYLLS